MKIVSVINYKGGVGKTSLTSNLGAELAWRGKKVLMLDLDPQTSLTFSFISPDVWEEKFSEDRTIKSWLESFDSPSPIDLASLIYTPERVETALRGRGKLDIISSHLGLINVDLELATKLGGGTIAQVKKNFINLHKTLKVGLSTIDSDAYDVVLIDCPPNFNIITKMAIIACDYILVPARPDFLSTMGIDYLIRNVNGLVKDYNDFANMAQGEKFDSIDPKVLGVVFTMIQEYGGGPMQAHAQFMNRVKGMTGISAFPSYIKRNDTLFADAPELGVPVVLNGYNSGSHQSVVDGLENVASDFRKYLGI
ncbi:MAG: AAA family ATPase [Methylotenera sp.]|nr:AAA family ATPase [Methylotenera sp.]